MWGVFSIMFGGLCGLFALVLIVLDSSRYRKATGTIIGNASHTGETIEMYAPTVRFRTEVGTTRTFQSICYFSSKPYREGDNIPVRYHPSFDKLNGVNKLTHRLLGPIMFGVFAVMFIWLGVQI